MLTRFLEKSSQNQKHPSENHGFRDFFHHDEESNMDNKQLIPGDFVTVNAPGANNVRGVVCGYADNDHIEVKLFDSGKILPFTRDNLTIVSKVKTFENFVDKFKGDQVDLSLIADEIIPNVQQRSTQPPPPRGDDQITVDFNTLSTILEDAYMQGFQDAIQEITRQFKHAGLLPPDGEL
jgi:hypothetical protein